MTVVPPAPLPLPPWLPASCDLTQAHFRRRGTSCVHYNSQGSVPKDIGYMCRVSLCPHCLVFLLGGLRENLIFVGAIFIGLTNFPRWPRGLPLAIYVFVGYCGVR
jgi:hypothetical protein